MFYNRGKCLERLIKSPSVTGYKFPNDEREQDRLDMIHHMFKLALGGKLFLAPIENGPLRILDIGTGTGIWAIEAGTISHFPAAVLQNQLTSLRSRWIAFRRTREFLHPVR